MSRKINTTKIFKGLAEYDISVMTNLATDEIGILLTGVLAIGIFGSISILSRGFAVPAVLATILVPVAVSIIAPQVSQILTQMIIVVTILYVFQTVRRRY